MPPDFEPTTASSLLGRKVRIGSSTCFLCSAPLRTRNRSDEHVFPKWLQKKFNLWDQQLTLINLTGIPYRRLSIPCCKTCNNVHLARIEDTVRVAVENGPLAVSKLPPATLYMWLSKIFYGILYRETMLRHDRARGKRTIVPRAALRELRLHHDFMQGIRRPVDFPFGLPGSIFIFGTAHPNRVELAFDFIDNHQNKSIALRLGSVGIVCCLEDGGLTKAFHDHLRYSYHRRDRLHPVQFREMTAQLFYKSMLLESASNFVVVQGREKLLVMVQNPPFVTFREWNIRTFCTMLAHFWGQPLEDIYAPGLGYISSLKDDDGGFRRLDPDAHYVFQVPGRFGP